MLVIYINVNVGFKSWLVFDLLLQKLCLYVTLINRRKLPGSATAKAQGCIDS